MALLKLPFRLGRPSNDTPVTTSDAVDDETLQATQAELNALFNQGKNARGEQVGKTYSAGTGIAISDQDEISVKAASGMERGGIRLGVMAYLQDTVYNDYPVIGSTNETAKVSVPVSTDSHTGLMSAEDHRRLNAHAFTVDFGANQDSVTVLHMDAACRLVRVATRNVSSVTVSVVNGGSVTPELTDGKADISLSCPGEAGIVIDIARTAAGDAAVGIRYELE